MLKGILPNYLLLLLLNLATVTLFAEETTEQEQITSDVSDEEVYVQATITDPFIELRTGPASGFPIFYVAEQGEWIEILSSKTTWYKVRLSNDKEGWVHKDQLKRTLNVEGDALDIADPGFDEFLNRTCEIGVLAGDFEGASSNTLYGGCHFTQNLSSELAFTQALGNFSEIRLATINIINEPFPDWQPFTWVPGMEEVGVSPFFGIGAGVIETLPRATLVQVEDRVDDLLFVTAGTKIYLSRRFLLQLEYRNLAIITNRNDNEKAEEWKIGFSIFF